MSLTVPPCSCFVENKDFFVETCGVRFGLYCGSAQARWPAAREVVIQPSPEAQRVLVLWIYDFLPITHEVMETGLPGNPFLGPGLLSNKLCALSHGWMSGSQFPFLPGIDRL